MSLNGAKTFNKAAAVVIVFTVVRAEWTQNLYSKLCTDDASPTLTGVAISTTAETPTQT